MCLKYPGGEPFELIWLTIIGLPVLLLHGFLYFFMRHAVPALRGIKLTALSFHALAWVFGVWWMISGSHHFR
jgi:hypothetical protein